MLNNARQQPFSDGKDATMTVTNARISLLFSWMRQG